ncbi:MAG TPA: heavy metal translocating P-type ATPase [Microbacterium sp.]|nr:heavy metal translocating P-type ATPase [Microbacterium sp.]
MLRLIRRYPIIAATLVVGVVVIALDLAGTQPVGQILATAYVAAVIVWTAIGMVRSLLGGHFGLDILAVVAMVATLVVGEYLAALIIVLMLSGGEALEDYASRRARHELTALLENTPQQAHVIVDQSRNGENAIDVDAAEVATGDTLLVRPAEIVPVDGVLLTAEASFDQSSLTGESLPVSLRAGEEVLSGSVNGSQAVRLRALRPAGESQYQQIVALVREAQESRAPMVRLADRFAVPFTVVSLVLAAIAWIVSGDPVRFAEVLVLATPCPLLIAAPVAFLGGLSRSAKAGMIVKGGGVIEQLARVRSAAFDKTGTLTAGRPHIVDVRPAAGFEADEMLRLAASAEQSSTHVLAEGIRAAAVERGLKLAPIAGAEEVATSGVRADADGRSVAVGKPAFIAALAPDVVRTALESGQAAAYVAIDGRFAGALVIADDPRPESADVVRRLHEQGVERIVILTGDVEATAAPIAATLGIREVNAELLPAQKVAIARDLQPRPVMMIGDGVNDAPVLAAADVGVAMGARGATAAGEAADAVILKDSLWPLVDGLAIARFTLRVALAAIWIGIALSVGLMLIAMTGAIPAVVGALTQELVDLATILTALLALRGPSSVRRLAQSGRPVKPLVKDPPPA